MMRAPEPGFTLAELLIVIAVAAVLLTVGVPGFRDFILLQRLKGINAQLVTDLQFARSEAASRNQWARMSFRSNTAMSCYTVYTTPPPDRADKPRCNCLLGSGAACAAPLVEVRTVQVPRSDGVRIEVIRDNENIEFAFAFDHVSGGIYAIPTDDQPVEINSFKVRSLIDNDLILLNEVGRAGRVNVCAPASTRVGAAAC